MDQEYSIHELCILFLNLKRREEVEGKAKK